MSSYNNYDYDHAILSAQEEREEAALLMLVSGEVSINELIDMDTTPTPYSVSFKPVY